MLNVVPLAESSWHLRGNVKLLNLSFSCLAITLCFELATLTKSVSLELSLRRKDNTHRIVMLDMAEVRIPVIPKIAPTFPASEAAHDKPPSAAAGESADVLASA